ncbi:GNAT family N-acetyltransferase [Clostridium sp. 'deep sea']|uniref:GNAT family N-acetyltransferase n=1 Tax=Clostridium sp. 'deep sea' TaxID=2779445 RepID=UPI0018966054|nr:GNAT family N-acetyltransferase [Clostridium sp. 'deep sea']QOR36086.1 GNAT family N-acetyltransferase [Clostridium sp. 'deep sea']
MNLRLANNSDLLEIKELWQYCFDDSEQFVNYYFKNRYIPENTLVIEENSRIITSLQMNQYQLHVANKTINTSYIVGISTLPDKRGIGLMKRILPAALQAIKSKGQSFALMMAIDSRLYLKYQFAYICEQLCFNYQTANCKKQHINVSYKKASHEDSRILMEIYNRKYRNTFIKLLRDEEFFKELIKELASENINLFLIKDNDLTEYTGYFTYLIEENTFYIRELCYLNLNTLHGILNFVYQHSMQADTAEIITCSNDFLKQITPINKHTEINIFPFIMGRIINVAKFLNFNLPNAKKCEITIKVIDNYLAENNNCYLLKLKNNQLTTLQTTNKPQLEMGIETLTQVSCGYLSAIISREMGLITVFDEVAFMNFTGLFNKSNNYLNEYV